MTKAKDSVDLDSILNQVGQFGRYQIRTYCFILLPILFSAVYNSQYIFTAPNVQYRCQVPQCEASPPEWNTNGWGAWSLPENPRCSQFVSVGTACRPESFTNQTQACSSWVFAEDAGIVQEFNIACQEWQRTLVGTIHSAGLFAALPLTAYISDTFGRRTAFILTAVLAGVSGLIRSFSPNYIMYVIMEFMDSMLGSGAYSTGFILALEMVGLKYRVLGGNLISSTYATGQVVVALFAWKIPEWRTLTRVLYAPSLLFVFYYFVLEESVRWLLSKGNKKEAARIIFKAAEYNKRKLNAATVKKLTDENAAPALPVFGAKLMLQNELFKKPEKSIFWQVMHSRILISRLAVCSFWWITVTFIYYGLSINSVSLAGNRFLNYILTALVEIPGYTLSVLSLDRFGRKSSIMTAFFICGLSLAALPFVPNNLLWLQTCLNLLGKLCISMSFSSIYIYTLELFPTEVRHRMMGACSMVGRIGSIVAPQTPLLMAYMESLPYLIFGVMAFTSGALMLLTPETLHMRLPDTIHEAENIATAPRSSKDATIIVD